ncbi:DUF6708 domain-containing protein [Pseudomonas sp. HR96]|uniref:DUF6708 domain-containing protein n=1 Tax=Pseudomonas sp. HR96 TaxID=1027966 RepID=UPI002A748FD6|nr:DUF6708 domain-containing protein [Pseudomonas sp. HR96]WPP02230.1 DUF6708 domain-containing protein [Pseudomonas sp. HR96]
MRIKKQPLLHPRHPGWKKDLSAPNELPGKVFSTEFISNPPNYFDEIYLELPRGTLNFRGPLAIISIVMMVFLTVAGAFLFDALLFCTRSFEGLTISLFVHCLLLLATGTAIWGWRLDTECPRDEPIRFNRVRRKVYVYRFRSNAFRLFSRTEWGVHVDVFDWDDLHAEYCSAYGPMGSGGKIEFVMLAVREPGTNIARDRFKFAGSQEDGESYWAIAQLFMQQGPHAIPAFDRPPRDWNNEDDTLNIARRLAPKVKWPEDIDLESRTAPD